MQYIKTLDVFCPAEGENIEQFFISSAKEVDGSKIQ